MTTDDSTCSLVNEQVYCKIRPVSQLSKPNKKNQRSTYRVGIVCRPLTSSGFSLSFGKSRLVLTKNTVMIN